MRNQGRLAAFTAAVPARVADLRQRIAAATTPAELIDLWEQDLAPFYRMACQMLQAGTSRYENAARGLRHDLKKLVGEVEANTLMTGLHAGPAQLASLGPLLGLAQVARGALSREDFVRAYGHRGPHEFEVSWPRPAEDPDWIERQLEGLRQTDVDGLLARQTAERAAAWDRFRRDHPRPAPAIERRLSEAAEAARGREAIRSEIIRVFGVLREFARRAGALAGLGEGVFFLSHAELLALLRGDRSSAAFIPARRATHARYNALPPYPALISGRFDPIRWAADPRRRGDFFDAHQAQPSAVPDGCVRGFPGAAGVVEGPVRVLRAMEDGAALQAGEVLVTVSTNVGWTPLFPRAAAIVTDVGAPLSHAAIVARELGLPAVVGCGDATLRLKTGDRVRVDGGRGMVEVLA
jgi:pyruvate,water dikinase